MPIRAFGKRYRIHQDLDYKILFLGGDNMDGQGTTTPALESTPALLDVIYVNTSKIVGTSGYMASNPSLISAEYDASSLFNIAVLWFGEYEFENDIPVTTIAANIQSIIATCNAAGFRTVLVIPSEYKHNVAYDFDDISYSKSKQLASQLMKTQTSLGSDEVFPMHYDYTIGQKRTNVAGYWGTPEQYLSNIGHQDAAAHIQQAINRILADTDKQTLPAVEGFKAVDGDGSITLSWKGSLAGATYTLYRTSIYDPGGIAQIYTGTDLGHTDTIAAGGYYYWIKQAYTGMHTSPLIAVRATSSASVLSAVTGLSNTPTATQVTLNWSLVTGATSYKVLRSTWNNFDDALPIGTTASNSFVDLEGDNAGTWYYWVVAQDLGTKRRSTPTQTTIN